MIASSGPTRQRPSLPPYGFGGNNTLRKLQSKDKNATHALTAGFTVAVGGNQNQVQAKEQCCPELKRRRRGLQAVG